MNISVIAPTHVPAMTGGAERLIDGIIKHLNETTEHVATLVTLPVREDNLIDLIDAYRQFAELDVSGADLVISSKYPAWMVEHPNHAVYMMHPLRGLYDTYHLFGLPETSTGLPGELASLQIELKKANPDPRSIFDLFSRAVDNLGPSHPAFTFPGPLARELVHTLDAIALNPRRMARHLAISSTVARRRNYFPENVDVRAVIPPSHITSLRPLGYKGFFTASRLDGPKRIDLLIDAMSYVPPGATLTIAGDGPERDRLMERAQGNPSICFVGHLSEQELLDAYANALAIPFVPIDEDLGLVTLEAQMSAKPVITCLDSGGSTELVTNMVNGFVVNPDPFSIGASMTQLFNDREMAERMGKAGQRYAQRFTWDVVINALVDRSVPSAQEADESELPTAPVVNLARRHSIVVLSTYPLDPPNGGGALRCRHLFTSLGQDYDVEYLAFGSSMASGPRVMVSSGLAQTVHALTPQQAALEARLASMSPIPIGDVSSSLYAAQDEAAVELIQQATRTADLVILEQPYLLPILRIARPSMPFIYDSQNAEFLLKDSLLADDDIGRQLKQVVRNIEEDAVRGAEGIAYCSPEDREKLETLGPTLAEWQLIPNGTDIANINFVSGKQRSDRRDTWLAHLRGTNPNITQEGVALFVGSYHPPNIGAAECIVRMAACLPDVLFVLAGGHTEAFEQWRLPNNVVMTGQIAVGDLRTLLSVADVSLVPIVTGSGTNLKLAEAFAAGLPVVSTEVGTRGYQVTDGRELLVASIEDFPHAIRTVLDDPQRASQRARAAYEVVRSSFDWEVIGQDYRHFVARILVQVHRHRPTHRLAGIPG